MVMFSDTPGRVVHLEDEGRERPALESESEGCTTSPVRVATVTSRW